MSWLFSLFLTLPVWAQVPQVSEYDAKIRIEATWVRWEGERAFIESGPWCASQQKIGVYDVRGRHDLRSQVPLMDLHCEGEMEGVSFAVQLEGRMEWLTPRDFSGWVTGQRDLLRGLFLLRVRAPQQGIDFPTQQVSGQEFLSENLFLEDLIFRVSTPDLVEVRCGSKGCESKGLPVVFRAIVEIKKSLPFD